MSGLDMTESIVPRSDQINADDLIAGPATYTIREVIGGKAEHPFDFLLVETPTRAYRPSKSMRRVIVAAWGADAAAYTGRRLTLYREPTITFGGKEVGGIRISHMSDIPRALDVMSQVARGKREKFTVHPLPEIAPPQAGARDAAPAGSDPRPPDDAVQPASGDAATVAPSEPARAQTPQEEAGATSGGEGPSLRDQYAALTEAERDDLRRLVPIAEGAKLSDVEDLLGAYAGDIAGLLGRLRTTSMNFADLAAADAFQRQVEDDTLPPTASQDLKLAGQPAEGQQVAMYGDGAPS